MPHKYHANRRHRIPRVQYRVRNWRDYEAGLRQRGSLTIWFTEDAVAAWRAAARTTPGGQGRYSALAIETSVTLRIVFHLALRQTEGLDAVIGPGSAVLERRRWLFLTVVMERGSSGSAPSKRARDSHGLFCRHRRVAGSEQRVRG
jgi:hypothetical protein